MIDLSTIYDDIISGTISKKDFISLLADARAISREDRLKLQIIDKSPFSVWACNINHSIHLWECRCTELYGYSKNEAINRSFIELFVAQDERVQAEVDCADIINNDRYIINLAGDINKYGRLVYLLTNCFKVTDEDSGEDLQAEIGLAISNSDWERFNSEYVLIKESFHRYMTRCTEFRKECNDFNKLCEFRIDEIRKSITNGKLESIKKGAQKQFNTQYDDLTASLKQLETSIHAVVESLKKAKNEDELSSNVEEFRAKVIDYNDAFEDISVNVLAILAETKGSTGNAEVVMRKDILLGMCEARRGELFNRIDFAVQEFEKFSGLIYGVQDLMLRTKQRCDTFSSLRTDITNFFSAHICRIKNVYSITELQELEETMKVEYSQFMTLVQNASNGDGGT